MAIQEREHSPNDGSQAFNLEYEKKSSEKGLYDDIVSYLGEYRLNVQKYDYELQFSGQSINDLHLRDSYEGEPMYAKAKRAIDERKKKNLPTHREEAELTALGDPDNQTPEGLDYKLRLVNDGDTLIWGSPPGPREEGYGKYGFIFVGNINKKTPLELRLTMTAIRIDNPKLDEYNNAFSLLLNRQVSLSHEDEFLAHPFIKQGRLEQAFVDKIIGNTFSFEVDRKSQDIFKKVINKLKPSIWEFISFTKFATKEEKLKAFYALENYALELKERFTKEKDENIIYMDEVKTIPLKHLALTYGYTPPVVAGSCGATGSNSNNILTNNYEKLMKTLFGEEGKECGCLDGNTDNHYHCPDCEKRYADETNKTPDQRTKQCSCNFKFAC